MNITWDQTTPSIPILGSDEINLNPYKVPAEENLPYKSFLKDRARRQERPYVTSIFQFLSQLYHSLLTWVLSACVTVAKRTTFAPGFSKRLDLFVQNNHAHQQTLVSDTINMICSDLPKRSDVIIEVMDFAPGRMELTRPKFGEVSRWKVKPSWAQVRWIHVPFGNGWVSTFVEDEILSGGPRGFPFSNAGAPEFPYISTESMTFWSKSKCQRWRALVSYFSTPISQMNKDVGRYLLNNLWGTQELQDAVNSYRGQRGRRPTSFWALALAEMPLDLDESPNSSRLADRHFGHQERNDELVDQTLSLHPYYRNARLVRSKLSMFHRHDGFLLTLSQPLGVQYLHRDWFEPSIAAPMSEYMKNMWACLVPQAFHHLSKGVENWYRLDETWLAIYLATEMCMLPSSRLGGPGLAPEEAYFVILTRYKQRSRYEWDNRTAINLVNGLVELNDELHNWQSLLDRQQSFLERLRKDAVILEQYYKANPVDPGLEGKGEPPTQRVDRALKSVGNRRTEMDKIFHESSRVLEAIFRLRTIQQNELAVSAERSNKAVVIFTVVSLIFLPLSFLSSYFAIIPQFAAEDNPLSTSVFWKTSVPLAVAISLLSAGIAFRHRVFRAISFFLGLNKKPRAHDAQKMV